MKKFLSLLLSFIIIFSHLCCGISATAKYPADDKSADNMDFAVKSAEIIKNDDKASMLRIIGKLQPETSDFDFPYITDCVVSKDGRFVLQFSSEEKLLACLELLQSCPDIIYAERDIPIYTEALQDSTDCLSWGAEAIEADVYSKALAPATSDKTVIVALVDSGSADIDFLKDKLVPGYDFFDNDSDATNDTSFNSHGTFLASIIADCTRNLPVKIMPVRVLDSKNASLINVINGIFYAVDNGADVINISLGAAFNNCRSLEDAINYAESNNITVIVCAGNNKSDMENICPAHVENALTVSSINSDYDFSDSFSNFGGGIDLAAPGENISGYNAYGEITAMKGTSMSAAFVSAAAAMFLLDNPTCNSKQVRKALISCARDYGDKGWDEYYGWGVPKLGNLLNSGTNYVESISFAHDYYKLYEGDTLEVEPVICPVNASDKSFTLSTNNGNISINGNIITAVSQGTAMLTVISTDGEYSDTVAITVSACPELRIRNNPGTKIINYGEKLSLTAEITNRPENSAVWWYVEGIRCGEGEVFETAPLTGHINITAKLIDSDGLPVINSQGIEISDSETVVVKSGFFQIIISFLKNLFRLNRTVVQFIFEN